MKEKAIFKNAVIVSLLLLIVACSSPKEKRAVALYKSYCASCHLLPSIEDLPKTIWEKGVLPEMAARMGIIDSTNNPYKRLTFDEQNAIMRTGIYPNKPIVSKQDWNLIKNYIISMAPDTLIPDADIQVNEELVQFVPRPIDLDSLAGTFITFLKYDAKDNLIATADLKGNLIKYDMANNKSMILMQTGEAITYYTEKDSLAYVTSVGYLNPSEVARGNILIQDNKASTQLPIVLHRPVHTLVLDLNKDGKDELVVCEFGDLTGSLSLLSKKEDLTYKKEVLLNLPGSIRTIAKDMNGDGKVDLVVLSAQGFENITILYQQEDLKFVSDPVIRLSPVYGSSWFELVDYDGDGDDDIVIVNGDNADKSYVQKPYHGMRIYLNDGTNQFEEKYFYPLNGATRVVARDFDQDGDLDFGLLSSFPDYVRKPVYSFVYLENKSSEKFQFKSYTFQDSKLGHWLLLDAGDFDNDGDDDIVLSSFTYAFTPVPTNISNIWKKSNADLMILENNMVHSKN